jgi:hypothetical protein
VDSVEIGKLFIGIVTAVGTIAVASFNFGQARKVKAELLEKFELVLEKEKKHSVTELFRLIHGLRMSYTDIVELVKHDDCSKIIYALSKTPGLVCYEQGEFRYTGIAKSLLFQFCDRWFTRLAILVLMLASLGSLTVAIYAKNLAVTASGFVMVAVFSFVLATQLRQRRYDRMVANLIHPTQTQQNAQQPAPTTEPNVCA